MRSALGILVFLFLAWALSESKKKIAWRWIAAGIALQFALGFLLLRFPGVQSVLQGFNAFVTAIDRASKEGASFVFGYLGGGAAPFAMESPQNAFIIAFQVLPIVIVVSALSSLLYHFGILQWVIRVLSWFLRKFMGADGATALGVASSVFLGIIESPLFVKPYLASMSRSSLFALMTAGMATIAGTVMVLYATVLEGVVPNAAGQLLVASVMSAPAALVFAQLMVPTTVLAPPVEALEQLPVTSNSPFEAIINGTLEGISMVINIVGVLIVLFAFIALINMGLGLLPLESAVTIQQLAGYLFVPFCWLMGIPSQDLMAAAELMGAKTMLNEFVAYTLMAKNTELSENTRLILTYAMCGFANFGSLGILIGGLGTIVPERKSEISNLALKAIVAGTLATMMTGAIVALL